MGRRVGKKYRVKWTDLNYSYELEHGACLDLSKVRPQKQLKIVAPPALAPISVGSVVAVSNDYDGLEHCPHLNVKFQSKMTKSLELEARDFLLVEFEAWPKIHSACEIEKADLFA